MEKMPQQILDEQEQVKGKRLKMPVIVNDKKYKPEYSITIEQTEKSPQCVCCGSDGIQWRQCVDKIYDYDTDDEKIIQEIEQKLRNIVREIEENMSVCAECYEDEQFLQRGRKELYIKVAKDVTKKYNGEEVDFGFILDNKDNDE
jgi:hypothetical protein